MPRGVKAVKVPVRWLVQGGSGRVYWTDYVTSGSILAYGYEDGSVTWRVL